MNTYHVIVEPAEDGWLAAHALENPSVITQGRTLDEVVFMVRDAIELLTGETRIPRCGFSLFVGKSAFFLCFDLIA
ncbi:MAG: type II toxin-antitoxin system HicB family antitoxin [Phycisphaeraceae bacterium]